MCFVYSHMGLSRITCKCSEMSLGRHVTRCQTIYHSSSKSRTASCHQVIARYEQVATILVALCFFKPFLLIRFFINVIFVLYGYPNILGTWIRWMLNWHCLLLGGATSKYTRSSHHSCPARVSVYSSIQLTYVGDLQKYELHVALMW